jgi:hypothetical protein
VDEAVTEPGPTLAEPTDEGLRLVDAADAQGVVLRLVGGVAIWARCPSARRAPLARPYNDIDFVTRSGSTAAVTAFFAGQGYAPNRMFNALHGARRLMYADQARGPVVDVLVDRFAMCHQLDLRDRLPPGARTLPLADLLLTKLQVVELNEKDLLAFLLVDLDAPQPLVERQAAGVRAACDQAGLELHSPSPGWPPTPRTCSCTPTPTSGHAPRAGTGRRSPSRPPPAGGPPAATSAPSALPTGATSRAGTRSRASSAPRSGGWRPQRGGQGSRSCIRREPRRGP